jgi:hypothetical protein
MGFALLLKGRYGQANTNRRTQNTAALPYWTGSAKLRARPGDLNSRCGLFNLSPLALHGGFVISPKSHHDRRARGPRAVPPARQPRGLQLGREGQVEVAVAVVVGRLFSNPLHRRTGIGQRRVRARFFFVAGTQRRRCCRLSGRRGFCRSG